MLICIQLLLSHVAEKNQAQFLQQHEYSFSSILLFYGSNIYIF